VATVSVGTAEILAKLENVTTLGLGLASQARLKAQTELTINLPDGRSLIGYVCWAESGKFGVRLLEPLALDDPLLMQSEESSGW